MSNWEKLKDIRGLLTGLVTAFTVFSLVGLALLDWRIGVHVRTELAKQDLATDSNIVSINTGVADNKRTGEENAEDIAQNRRNVEAAFRRLMGMPLEESDDE